ncbi:MAG TPA: lysylphosphatidylglycerol synthase transmembrane domain-containing protein, partial [Candidatus Limnocylindrales bacterium]
MSDANNNSELVPDYPGVHEESAPPPPLSRRLRNPRTIISIVLPISIILLVLTALPGFHLDQLPSLIANANPWLLLTAFVIYYVGFPLRGYRWALLLRGAGTDVGVRDSTEIVFLSWLVNCLVPAKLGDVYRAYLLKVNKNTSISRTFGTIFIERVFDLFAIVLLGLAAGYWSFRAGMSPEV